jgi:SAM-dependent MidA family methyltransferase
LATYDQDDVPPGFPVSGDLPAEYITELWPHSEFWAGELARVLARGKILTIDYGLEAKDLYAPHRKEGTLQAYHRQKRSPNLLDHIGEQDITAHVNFTALIEAGKQAGLRAEVFSTQERFLMGVLKTVAPDEMQRFSDSEKRQLNMLIHPDILGHVFKVLVQSK